MILSGRGSVETLTLASVPAVTCEGDGAVFEQPPSAVLFNYGAGQVFSRGAVPRPGTPANHLSTIFLSFVADWTLVTCY